MLQKNALLLMLVASGAIAKDPPIELDDMVRFSTMIFEGQVVALSDDTVLADNNGEFRRLSVMPHDMFCGRFIPSSWPNGQMQLLVRSGFGQFEFEQGQRYVFFVRESDNGPLIAPGIFGALELSAERTVDGSMIQDIERILGVEELRTAIDCAKATGGRATLTGRPTISR